MEHNTQNTSMKTYEEVVSYISNNLSNIDTLDDLVSGLHMSKSYLCRLFARYSGGTIMRYIHNLRLQKVEEFVKAGHSVSAAAYLAGYQNYSVFFKCFRKCHQMTPTQYYQEVIAQCQKDDTQE